MEISAFFANLALFAAKGLLVFCLFFLIILVIAFFAARAQTKHELKVENLKEKFDHYKHLLQFLLTKNEFKKIRKAKELEKKEKQIESKPRAFVLSFEGDMRAQADQLRHEVTAVLTIAQPGPRGSKYRKPRRRCSWVWPGSSPSPSAQR